MRRENTKRFGEIALEGRFVPADVLERALETQRAELARGVRRLVGEILVEAGALDAPGVDEILRLQRTRHQRRSIGPYEIEGAIGQGGMGKVYLARRRPDGLEVALKILPSELAEDPAFVSRFLREAKVSIDLSHPNLVRGLEVGHADGSHFLALEYVRGPSLARRLRDEGRLDEATVLRIAIDVARALAAAHDRDWVHRDVKPSNVVLAADGRAVLLDLGLARTIAGATRITRTNQIVGTPDYMSPEQIRGDEPIGPAADFYGLGTTIYHAATGEPPFARVAPGAILQSHLSRPIPDPRRLVPELSDGLVHVLSRLLAKAPRDRYPDAETLLADLEALLDGRPPLTPPLAEDATTVAVDDTREVRRHRRRAARRRSRRGSPATTVGIAAGTGALALVAILLAVGTRGRPAPDPPPAAPERPETEPARRVARDELTGLVVGLPEHWAFEVSDRPADPVRLVLSSSDRTERIEVEAVAKPAPPVEYDLELRRALDVAGSTAVLREEPVRLGSLAGILFAGRRDDRRVASVYLQDDRAVYAVRYKGPEPSPRAAVLEEVLAGFEPAIDGSPEAYRRIETGWGLSFRCPADWRVVEKGQVGESGGTLRIVLAGPSGSVVQILNCHLLSNQLLEEFWTGIHARFVQAALAQAYRGHGIVLERELRVPYGEGRLAVCDGSPGGVAMRLYMATFRAERQYAVIQFSAPKAGEWAGAGLVFEHVARTLAFER